MVKSNNISGKENKSSMGNKQSGGLMEKLSLKDKLRGLNIPKEDFVLLRICGIVGLICASFVAMDLVTLLSGCSNEGCGLGVPTFVLALLPTLINTPVGVIAFIYIQMKLKKNPKNARIMYKIKQVNKELWILLLMVLSPIILFGIFISIW